MDQTELIQDLDRLVRNMQQALHTLNEAKEPLNATAAQVSLTKEHLNDLRRMTEDGTNSVLTTVESLQATEQAIQKQIRSWSGAPEQQAEIQRLFAENDQRFLEAFTALSFQDLVAQRLLKVLSVLNDFEQKLLQLIGLFALDRQEGLSAALDNSTAGRLLKQMDASKKTALEQAAVNDMLAEYRFSSETGL